MIQQMPPSDEYVELVRKELIRLLDGNTQDFVRIHLCMKVAVFNVNESIKARALAEEKA